MSVFKPVQFFGSAATLMEVDIPTGRTHQIRVHAAFAGHPLLGDDKYGDRDRNAEFKRHGLKRIFLHAQSVAFDWPGSESAVSRERAVARGPGLGAGRHRGHPPQVASASGPPPVLSLHRCGRGSSRNVEAQIAATRRIAGSAATR